MAKQEKQVTDLAGAILGLLRERATGMEVEAVVAGLAGDGAVSPRGVRNLLNRLAEEGRLVRRKRKGAGRGTPPYLYYHPDTAPRERTLFDEELGGQAARLHTRGDAEEEVLDSEERARLDQARSVLANIAKGHLNEERYARAIIDAAPKLAELDPVDLIIALARWVVEDLNKTADRVRDLWRRTQTQQATLAANELEVRLGWAKRYFYRLWRLDRPAADHPGILDLPSSPRRFVLENQRATLDEAAARARLQERVRGCKVVEQVRVGDPLRAAAGTDASVADIFLEHNRGSFIPPDPVSVMTGAAALITRAAAPPFFYYQDFDIFPDKLNEYEDHRAAIEGLVISPLLRHILPEEDFKHSRLAAMDLRQYDEDFRIAVRQAKWRPVGSAPVLGVMPRPALIIRDGRLLPLVHRLKDFESDGLYGQIVRNEVERFSHVVHQLSGPSGEIVYGATVKSPEMSWLAPLVFWHLHVNKVKVDGRLVVPAEDEVYRARFADTAVSHLLFFGLAKRLGTLSAGLSFITFRAIRRFSDIALEGDESFPLLLPDGDDKERPLDENDPADWEVFLARRVAEHRSRRRENTLEVADYGPFVYLCSQVGVAMCYSAPVEAYGPLVAAGSGEGAHFLLPRIEVAVLTRAPDKGETHLRTLLTWMATGGCEMDRGHTHPAFDTGREPGLPILVPDVIVAAHEAATFARDKMSEEVQDEIRNRIADLRRWITRRR
jgi:hypothetical protein